MTKDILTPCQPPETYMAIDWHWLSNVKELKPVPAMWHTHPAHEPIWTLANGAHLGSPAWASKLGYRYIGPARHDAEETLRDVLVHLIAAVSLLKHGGKKAAPSNKMFDQMILDYEQSIARGRAFFTKEENVS